MATFVLINTDENCGKLNNILSDATKFVRIRKNLVEEIKKKLNGIFKRDNAVRSSERLPMVIGDHDLGYIYGNVKAYKHGNPQTDHFSDPVTHLHHHKSPQPHPRPLHSFEV